jgi:hypothetical protein
MTPMIEDRLVSLGYWVREREAIRKAKEAGKPKPWTLNLVLRGTRFCNVRRMDDKVSRWLLDTWYEETISGKPLDDAGQTLASAGMARLINWPDTLEHVLEHTIDTNGTWHFDQAKMINVLRKYRDAGNKIFTGAYIINAAGANGSDKIEVVCRQASTLYKHGELLLPDTMKGTHAALMRVPGIGSFIAGQIVADLRHICPGEWSDRMSWAPIGPGSRRGIAWLVGWDGNTKLNRLRQEEFEEYLVELIAWVKKNCAAVFRDRKLEAHDIQNCLCEYDKFMRLTNETGRGKNKYPGAA